MTLPAHYECSALLCQPIGVLSPMAAISSLSSLDFAFALMYMSWMDQSSLRNTLLCGPHNAMHLLPYTLLWEQQ